MTHDAVVFTDLNCPFCYATEERLHALGVADRVQWAGVQHAPHLPVPMAPAGPELERELPAEVEAVRASAPEVEIALPPGKPNTELAIRYGAAATAADPEAGRRFVRALYRAFWTAQADLSEPAVLDGLARDAGLDGLRPGDTDEAVAAGWQEAWERTALGGVPLLVRHDGEVVYGLGDIEQLRAFMDGAPARD